MLTWVVLSLFLFSGIDCAEEWSYAGETGPDHWAEIDGAFCDGESQSPIDIDTGNVVLQDYEDWTMEGYNFDEEVGYATLVSNNGHTLAVNLAGDFSLSGGGLPNKFKAAQFHFHWGSVNTQGSEHTVDRTSFPAELHIVHYNDDKYDDLGAAVTSNDNVGLAVLGVFMEVGRANEAFNEILELAEAVPFKDETVDAENTTISVADLLPGDLTKFYRYSGSLTTPTCNEVVVWTVFEEPIQISQAQLNILRGLHQYEDGEEINPNIEDNYRPVLPLNGRSVYYSSAQSMYNLSLLLSTSCLIFCYLFIEFQD